MFREQNHVILIACKRALSLIVGGTFSQVYILFIILGFFPPLMCVTGLTWVLAALLSWRASLERRKRVFFLLQARTGPSSAFLAFFSCPSPAGTGMTYSGRQGEETAVAWVLALSPRWAVSDCRHHGDSFEELTKPTAFFLCRMMKMLMPRQLKANAEGFYPENMLRAQCYSWSLATPKLVNIPDTLEKFSSTCLICTDLFCYYFGFLLPGTQGIWHSPKTRRGNHHGW